MKVSGQNCRCDMRPAKTTVRMVMTERQIVQLNYHNKTHCPGGRRGAGLQSVLLSVKQD